MPVNRTRVITVVRHPVGGIRTYLRYTYGALPAGKYDFTVLAAQGPETAQLARDLEKRTGRLIEIPDGRGNLPFLRAVARVARTGNHDLIHSHGFTAGVIAGAANIGIGLPHVVTSHDVFRADQFTGPGGRVKAWLLTQMLKRADVIQSVSADAQRNLVAYLPGITATSLVVIPNGIDVERFRPADAASAAASRTGGRRIVFGFFGRLMPQKGFDYLVNAVQMLADQPRYRDQFLVRVISDGGFIREQRASIDGRGLASHFDFGGFVPDISGSLAAVDAVVMPSLWEACPLVAMEAMVAGRPLIATRCIGLREVIRNTVAFGVEPADSSTLADAMREVMEHPSIVADAARSFAPAARDRFDVRRTSEALDALLDRALSMSRRAGVPALEGV